MLDRQRQHKFFEYADDMKFSFQQVPCAKGANALVMIAFFAGISLVGWATFHGLIRPAHAQVNVGMFLAGTDRSVAEIRATVPRKLDNSTTLIDVARNGMVVTYSHELNMRANALPPDFLTLAKTLLAQNACKSAGMTKGMGIGMVYRYTYRDAAGSHIGSFDITKPDCK